MFIMYQKQYTEHNIRILTIFFQFHFLIYLADFDYPCKSVEKVSLPLFLYCVLRYILEVYIKFLLGIL